MPARSIHSKGFTIVELIVVIAVVAILAGLTVVGYGAWRNSVISSAIKTELQNAAAAMEDARTFGGNGYPADVSEVFTDSEDIQLTGGSEDDETYCIEGTSLSNLSIRFYISSETKDAGPLEGTCDDRPIAPNAPSGLSASAVSSSQIDLTWSTVSGADTYTVQVASNSAFSGATTTNGITGTSHSATGLDDAKTYYLRVRAVNETGTSGWSGAVSAKTPTVNHFANLTWTERTSAGQRNWKSVASSSDGMKLAAAVASGYIYTSTDGGATWTERTSAGSRAWYHIVSSSNGMKLAAAVATGYIYTSSDGGATWTERTSAGSRQWWALASSADGFKLVAAPSYGTPYTSTDGGATWTARATGSQNWRGFAMSADGQTILGVASSNPVHISTDGGATWSTQTIGSVQWYFPTVSADGTKMAIAPTGNQGPVYYSTNGGGSWTEADTPDDCFTALDSSDDGTKIGASTSCGGSGVGYRIMTSLNSGVSWSQHVVNSQTGMWSDIAMSADGRKLIIARASSGYIYTGQFNH